MSLIAPTMWERTSLRTKLIVLAGVLLLLGLIFWAYSGGGAGEKERKLNENIGIDAGKNVVISNLVTNQQGVVNNAANQTQQGEVNFNLSVNRDSSTFGGSSTDKFCQRFVCDSSCAEWRKQQHPVIVCPPR